MRGDALRTAVDFAELPSTTDSRDSEALYPPRPARSDPSAVLQTDEVASPIKGWSPCVADVPRRKTVLQHKRPRVGTVTPSRHWPGSRLGAVGLCSAGPPDHHAFLVPGRTPTRSTGRDDDEPAAGTPRNPANPS